jgi:pantoate--beta-alanine ligase
MQFGPNEDLAKYPRQEAADVALLAAKGAEIAFCPGVAEMYPQGHATRVDVAGLTDCLCGAARPGHFSGMATIVTKLLLQALPDFAMFGEKDWQQLQVVRRLVRDLDVPVEIVGCPTVREADGLALSSRNVRLSPAQRAAAPLLNREMRAVAQAVAATGRRRLRSRAQISRPPASGASTIWNCATPKRWRPRPRGRRGCSRPSISATCASSTTSRSRPPPARAGRAARAGPGSCRSGTARR